MSRWTASDIPDQSGKVIVVTGANSGLGYETSLALARAGARVVMACRNMDKAQDAARRIRQAVSRAELELEQLDLASLASVRAFAERFPHEALDVLVNNAGIMGIPRRETADGFEMQIGTNHFGPFALTGLLLDRLKQSGAGRVVTVSSIMHVPGKIRFDDIHGERFYERWLFYAQSKLANLLFAYELQHRIEAANESLLSAAAHPGYSATNLQFAAESIQSAAFSVLNRVAAQPADKGALPSLYAATAPDVSGGDYYGPDGFMEISGHPKRVKSTRRSRDRQTQRRLWELSEELTGVRYDL